MSTTDEYGIPIHSFEKTPRKKIFLHVQEFKGRTFLDLREFYSQDGVWKPSPKGLTVPPELYPELLKGVVDAAEVLGVELGDSEEE